MFYKLPCPVGCERPGCGKEEQQLKNEVPFHAYNFTLAGFTRAIDQVKWPNFSFKW